VRDEFYGLIAGIGRCPGLGKGCSADCPVWTVAEL